MSTMCSIPMLIEAARAGARPGKVFVVEAEAYRPLPSWLAQFPADCSLACASFRVPGGSQIRA